MKEEQTQRDKPKGVTRRDFLKYATASAGVTAATLALSRAVASTLPSTTSPVDLESHHGHPAGVSVAYQTTGGRTPMEFLKDFYTGTVPVAGVREFELTATSEIITVAKNVQFPAWAFYGPPPRGPNVPGPTLRCVEGETVKIKFHNGDVHPHTIHLHGIHPATADGVFETINPGLDFEYTIPTVEPFGLFPYHCHVMPVKKHISKGLYGAFVVDPPPSYGTRPQADYEFVMVMNGFDVDFDDENEFYTVNGITSYYFDNPIDIQIGKLVRLYLVNMTEFDPVNSFHLHGNMFRVYRTGTRFSPTATFDRSNPDLDAAVRDWLRGPNSDPYAEITDVVFLGQGERAILEFIPKHTGRFLFHAHQSEFIELGWNGLFRVSP